MGQDLAYDKQRNFRFGSYVESHEYHKITKDMEQQIVNIICLWPIENFQESYKYFP